MYRKWLAIGIILLFVGIVCSSAISAYDDTILSKSFSIPKKNDMVSITVLEYKPDGTIGKSFVKLSKVQAEELKAELKNTKDFDIRLSIYKKYNLIPQDVTAEKLRLGMEENAQRLGLTQQRLEQTALIDTNSFLNHTNGILQDLKIYMNMFCKVEGSFAYSILLPLGLSFFTVYILRHHGDKFIIFDIRDRIISLSSGIFTTNGLLPDFDAMLDFSFSKILGFIGYFYYIDAYIPFVYCFGFASYVRTCGLSEYKN